MTKRVLLLVGLLIVALVVAACGEQAAPPAEEEEGIDIAFFVPWTEDVWYVAAIAGAEERAEELGVNLQVYDAGYDVATQVQQFDTAMASNPDAIVLSSVDPAAMVPSVEAAAEAGITVVDYDRPLWATDALDAMLILDTPGLGRIGCESIAAYLEETTGEASGTVIRAFGDLADTWVTDISLGWDPCMAQYPDIEVLSAMSGPWEPEEAAASVEQLLLTNEDVAAIFLDSDWLGSGITAYLESAGYGRVGEENHIYYVGVGGMPQALDYIREGWMDVTINNPVPDFAAAAVEVAYMLVSGEELPSEWVQEGAAWSPATIFPTPDYGNPPFPPEGTYTGPVLNMQNVLVGIDDVDDPGLWGNLVGGEEEEAEEVEEEAAVEPIDIAFFVPWTEDVWYVAAIAGAEERAEELGVNLQVYDAGYEVATQVQQFDTAMASNPDAIVLSSVDPAAMVPSVEAAAEAGITVVDYDRPLWASDQLDAMLILDTPGLGRIGCESIAAYLEETTGEASGTVIRAFGDLADTWVTDISIGWDPCIAQYPDIEVLSAMSGPWEPEEAAASVEQLLLTNEDVAAIFLDSDWLGSGITAYLESAGYGRVGEENHIYYVGVGGMPQALDYIREGWMDVTINNPVPDFAAAAVEVAYMLVNGEELPSEWVQEGAAWSPATIYPTPDYGTPPFPDEGTYTGPVLNMQNVLVGIDDVDDPGLWGNIVGGEEEEAEEVEEEAAVEPIDIAFFVPWTEDVWYVAAIAGAEERAEELGVNLQVYDAGYDVATQVQQFDTAMASNPDAIVLSSVDPAAMVPSVEAAAEAGITVVDYDRPLWASDQLDAMLILDTPGLGRIGCESIAAYLEETTGEASGTVIRAFGDLADTWVTDISLGWDPCMAQYPDIEVLSAMSGPWEPEEAAASVEQLLLTNEDVDAIFLDSDWLGSGITAYLESAGYGRVGEENHIYYVGVGGMPQALDYIREGWMDVTINNPVPDFAAAAVEVAYMLVNGEELPSEWVQEGAAWSPATIYPTPDYGNPPFPDEGTYTGPVLNMQNVLVGIDDVDDPGLWGNLVGE